MPTGSTGGLGSGLSGGGTSGNQQAQPWAGGSMPQASILGGFRPDGSMNGTYQPQQQPQNNYGMYGRSGAFGSSPQNNAPPGWGSPFSSGPQVSNWGMPQGQMGGMAGRRMQAAMPQRGFQPQQSFPQWGNPYGMPQQQAQNVQNYAAQWGGQPPYAPMNTMVMPPQSMGSGYNTMQQWQTLNPNINPVLNPYR